MDDKNCCSLCGKEFTYPQNVLRHMNKIHNVPRRNNTSKLRCPKCDIAIPTHKHLREHLAGTHEIQIEKEEKFFESVEEFKAWKTFVEKSSSDRYVREFSGLRIKSGSRTYYYCHRSGMHKSKATGKKMIKIQGSNKVGSTCPASMVVTEYDAHPGQVWVTYWKTHLGHDHKRSRAFLAENEREFIAKNLAMGVSFDNVLDEMLNGQAEVNADTLHPIDNPALHSMKRFLSDCPNYHPDDIASVEILIQELALSKEMATLYYKRQGEVDETGHFEIDDFMIILISSFQVKMVATFCSETFCIDAAIGKNRYDYQAVSVLTVDENAIGYPFATCITNRTDVKAMACFFKSVRASLSKELKCSILLTADIPGIVKAWSAVMGEPKYHLLSSWHVIKTLQKHLGKIKIPQYRTPVFQYLQVLIHESSTERFENLLVCFENDLKENPSTSLYYDYFQKNYFKRIKQWALCHRVELGIKTNKHFEAFHEIIRCIYVDGKKNHRLDNYLKALLKLTRDKLFDRRSISLKKKPTQIKHDMQESHAKGRLIAKNKVTYVSEGSYRVASEHQLNYSYIVTKENVDHLTCDLTCTACKICIHMYSCTCIDYLVKFTICKHIHACIISTWPDVVVPECYDETFCQINDVSDVVTVQLNEKDISTMSPIINLAGEIIVSSNAVTEITEDAYNKVIEYLELANNILKNAMSGTQQIQSLVVPSVSEIPDSTGEIQVATKNILMYDHTYIVLNENLEC
ncbi:uncharacterized protein LOC118186517 isoform X1 [Stegodyphus dumicola]|uniref:uncharacterized protein LOC118186517 isoform X1 n=1 Tax=Stegodyphus dumicola TaxID=202533 RepID=UPI0015AB85F9|nr:uncharacterized protein LOC118186517 isoform X1 [Stegodyphus dumicola]XP_035212516.1 uncharacterized protein LOC118186517 isoform X1 [Stegodyphus dumicola]XP_035212517.1 uncharacterized protein LOC118186517 isoform X1 [Stegodyphus dumicola]XP_035212518.1 uncharacterized protein LOC118186517 isoform X1 [Stegodyphus dumicola]